MKKICAFFALFCAVFLVSCGGGSSKPANESGDSVSNFGKLGGECYPNETCDKGLICDTDNNVCIEDPENQINDSDKTDSGDDEKIDNDNTDTTPEQTDNDDSPDNKSSDDDNSIIDNDSQDVVGEDVVPANEADKIQNQNNIICARLPNASFVPGIKEVTPNGNVSFVDTCITTIDEPVYKPDLAPHLFYLARLDLNTPHRIINMAGNLDIPNTTWFTITADIKIKNMIFESYYQKVDIILDMSAYQEVPVIKFYSSPPNSKYVVSYTKTKNITHEFTKDIITNDNVETIQQKNSELCKRMPNSVYTPNTNTNDDGTATITDTCSVTINDKIWTENVIPFLFGRGKLNWMETPYRIPYIEQRHDIENDRYVIYMDVVLNNMTLQIHLDNTESCLFNPNNYKSIDAEIAPSATSNDNCIRHHDQ